MRGGGGGGRFWVGAVEGDVPKEEGGVFGWREGEADGVLAEGGGRRRVGHFWEEREKKKKLIIIEIKIIKKFVIK